MTTEEYVINELLDTKDRLAVALARADSSEQKLKQLFLLLTPLLKEVKITKGSLDHTNYCLDVWDWDDGLHHNLIALMKECGVSTEVQEK